MLSPYLFIIAAELLSRLISKGTDEGKLTGLYCGTADGKFLNKLLFADDYLLVVKAASFEARNLQEVLTIYTTARLTCEVHPHELLA